MSVRYILGRAGSGKSTSCLTELLDKLLHDRDSNSPLVLLVPEQATFKAEHTLVTSPGIHGFMRVQVLSFRRLAFRVMQETGGSARIHIADNGRKMLLHKIVHRVKGQLKLFHSTADQPGFIDRLADMLVEFRRYRIDPPSLESEIFRLGQLDEDQGKEALTDKLHDLHILYTQYEHEIAGLYVDAEDDLAVLASKLGESSYAQDTEVWIDGFNGFTPQEYMVLASLIKHCKRVNIAICVDRNYKQNEVPDELDLFHSTATTLTKLRKLTMELDISEEQPLLLMEHPTARHAGHSMLAHLEQNLYSRVVVGTNTTYLHEEISLNSAVHRRAETEAAARRMIALVRDQGYRWRDMAIFVRNIADYRDVLVTTLSDYGIPHFFDQKKTVTHHPLLELIRAAIEVVKGGWRYDSIFRCVKTDMLIPVGGSDDPTSMELMRQAMDRLENYVLAYGIQGKRWIDGKPWTHVPHYSLEDAPQERTDKETVYLQQVNEARAFVVAPLLAFDQAIHSSETVRAMAAAVFGLLELTRSSELLSSWSASAMQAGRIEVAKEHIGIWGNVIDVLDQMVEMMGDEVIPFSLFSELLDTCLANIKLGLVPPALDQVLIGTMDRTRPGTVKHAFVLGANDGVLPSAMKEDGILSEQEREQLSWVGLELAPSSRRRLLDEQFMIYTALALPSHSLWISYPLSDDDGKALLPSEVIRRIRRMFPQLSMTFHPGEQPAGTDEKAALAHIVSPQMVLSALTVQLRQAKRGLPIADIWWDVYNWYVSQDPWRELLRVRASSLFYTNHQQKLKQGTSKLLYGSPLRASVSRMEKFVSCSFAHFASYGLRLRDRKLYRLEAPDIGQLFHAALSMIGLRLQQEGITWDSLTAEQCAERASAAVDLLSPRLRSEILTSSNRYRYLARKLTEVVSRAASVLADHGRMGSFQPAGLELGFGPNEKIPPLRFSLNDGTEMEIVGRIDRVDVAAGSTETLLRVIDYKSSSKRLNMAEVYYGLSLQMLTYLDVAVTHSKLWLGQEAQAGGLLYFHVHQPIIQSDNQLSVEDANEQLFKRFKMKGLVLAEEETVRLMDSSLSTGYSKLIPVAIKADGSFYKSASVMSRQQWGVLRQHGRDMIQHIGNRIVEGQVDINPYRMGQQTACTFCEYKPVCQIDSLVEGNVVKPLAAYPQDVVWQMMHNKGGVDL
ncbi:MAG: helicase-exonuclease AddAB subunit AddB [Paenibacillaceae bacterium]